MTMNSDIRKPRAFAPDDPALRAGAEPATGATGPREGGLASRRTRQTARTSVRPTVADLSRGIRWGGILLSSLVGLLALSTTLWFTRYVEVAVRAQRLGRLGFVLAALPGRAVGAGDPAARAVRAVPTGAPRPLAHRRQGGAEGQGPRARAPRGRPPHRHPIEPRRHVLASSPASPSTRARCSIAGDLLALADRELMLPLDQEARRTVLASAKRIGMVTAISPMVWIAMLYVLIENLRMLRAIAGLYGGRPGLIGALAARAPRRRPHHRDGRRRADRRSARAVPGTGSVAAVVAAARRRRLQRRADRPHRRRSRRGMPAAAVHRRAADPRARHAGGGLPPRRHQRHAYPRRGRA